MPWYQPVAPSRMDLAADERALLGLCGEQRARRVDEALGRRQRRLAAVVHALCRVVLILVGRLLHAVLCLLLLLVLLLALLLNRRGQKIPNKSPDGLLTGDRTSAEGSAHLVSPISYGRTTRSASNKGDVKAE